jgi:hypothetical protein
MNKHQLVEYICSELAARAVQRVEIARRVSLLGDTSGKLRSQYLAMCAEHHALDVIALRRFEELTGLAIPDAFKAGLSWVADARDEAQEHSLKG